MGRVNLEYAQLSDKGVVRNFNEDSVLCDREHGIFILADGMGGYKAGDVASSMATAIIHDVLLKTGDAGTDADYEADLSKAVNLANRSIFRTASMNRDYEKMGSTVVTLQLHDHVASIAHVGDSRLYRWRDGQLQQLTRDHSLLQEQITLGLISAEEARLSHNRNLVTRALGAEESVAVETQRVPVEEGDVFLLCSDGLNDLVNDEDIQLALSSLHMHLPLAAKILIQMANDNGGHDNVSVILVRAGGEVAEVSGLAARLFGWLRR